MPNPTAEHAIIASLLAVGTGSIYAYLVHLLEQRQPGHPYTPLLVAGGIGLTLTAAVLIVPWQEILAIGGLFLLTGGPQLLGSMHRYLTRAQTATQDAAQTIRAAAETTEVTHGDPA